MILPEAKFDSEFSLLLMHWDNIKPKK